MAIPQATVASSQLSQGSRRASALQSFGIRKRSEIDIILDGKDDFIRSYSTFDEIKGHVNLRFEKDTPIESLNITFHGQTNTWVEKMTSVSPRTGRATAKHVFLRMQQPIDGNPFSEDNVAEAGTTYTIPFNFVVPEKVLPFVCSHNVDDDSVRTQHHLLPPSIGESMLSGEGSTLMDDLCPAMAKVVYSIKVNVVKAGLNGRTKEALNNSVGVRIIPSRPELPPGLESPSKEGCLKYSLRKEKNVRKGLLKFAKKQGRLTAETSQPRSLKLSHPQQEHREASSTTATINLRYDPASIDDVPPQLTGVDSRIKAFTFFGAAPFKHLVDPTNYDIWSIMHSHYSLTADLSSMNLSSVQWTKHDVEGPFAERKRHGSVATTASSTKISGQRRTSTSTGTASTDEAAASSRLHRTPSYASHISDESYSATSSATTLSTPASPVMTTSNISFPQTTISPSTRYDQTLPFYTTSITVPVTLPSISSNPSNISADPQSRRSSSAVPDSAIPDPTSISRRGSSDHAPKQINTASSTPSLPSFSRKRGIPTFLPTFHSCLMARTYVLEMTVHAANPAPQINLRTPIQISFDLPPTHAVHTTPPNTLPLSWYDPFDQATNTPGQDAQDTANDEAIARALTTSHHHLHQHNSRNESDQIPSYADLQIQTTNNVASYSRPQCDDEDTNTVDGMAFAQAQRRHNSAPLTSLAPGTGYTEMVSRGVAGGRDSSDKPPEYNAPVGFRRRQQSSLRTPATQDDAPSGTANESSQRRRQSTGWTKKLGFRI